MFMQKFTCSNFHSSYFRVLVVGHENLDLAKLSHYTVLHYACAMQHKCLSLTWKACLREASQHQSTSHADKIATHTTWPKLWDMALDHSAQGTAALQALYCTLTRPSFGQKPCPFCDNHSTEPSHFEHLITCHTPFVTSEFIVELLIRESTDTLHAKHFLYRLYPPDPLPCFLL